MTFLDHLLSGDDDAPQGYWGAITASVDCMLMRVHTYFRKLMVCMLNHHTRV